MGSIAWSIDHDVNIANPVNNSTGVELPYGASVADVGKDWILSPRLAEKPDGTGAVNYGWRNKAGVPLQPEGGTHNWLHFDYSQVCRLMRRTGRYMGQTVNLLDVPHLWLPPNFPLKVLAPFSPGGGNA